jgi:hypothetical protein
MQLHLQMVGFLPNLSPLFFFEIILSMAQNYGWPTRTIIEYSAGKSHTIPQTSFAASFEEKIDRSSHL